MQKEKLINRVIRGYDRNNDNFVVELSLAHISLDVLQKIFNIEEENPMYDCYPIRMNEYRELKLFLKDDLDFRSIDYFLELK